MTAGSIGRAIEKYAETAVKASEVAELGAVKPEGFGTLIRNRYPSVTMGAEMREGYWTEFPHPTVSNVSIQIFGLPEVEKNPYMLLRYNEVAKECSEYLCDYGITPETWREAGFERRMEMLGTAVRIMARELKLPDEWAYQIEPIPVSGESYVAQVSCSAVLLDNGSVDIEGMPDLSINTDYVTEDYFEVISSIYHEMIHMKQYASVDCLAPDSTTDSRLLDLIDELKRNNGSMNSSYVSYLYSPFEAEAWAQEMYFRLMLQSVVQER